MQGRRLSHVKVQVHVSVQVVSVQVHVSVRVHVSERVLGRRLVAAEKMRAIPERGAGAHPQ